MVNQVQDIEFIKRKNKWFLWYINSVGDLDNIMFETESEAQYFKDGFQFIANSLYSNKEKWDFYEKTKLTSELISYLVNFGKSIKIIKETLDILNLKLEIALKSKDR